MTENRKQASNAMLILSCIIALGLMAYSSQINHQYQVAEKRARQWASIVEASHVAIVVCNEEGHIVQWNLGATELLGWTEEEAVGADLHLIIPPDRFQYHQQGFKDKTARAQLERGDVLDIEGFVVDNQGVVLPVSIRLSMIHNGEVLYVAQIAKMEDVKHLEPTPAPPQMKVAPPELGNFNKGKGT